MKIAIFDHLVDESNAIGKCHLKLLSSLADEHEFTVFAINFDNPRPDHIRFVKVPGLRYPLLGLMVSFHIIAPFILWWHRSIKGEQFDLVQGIGGNFIGADLAYGHFCHRVYLREHKDARPKTFVRRMYYWIYDSIVSMLEPAVYKRANYIVTPSQGLARELQRHFKGASPEKIQVIANPVDVERMAKADDFDPRPLRKSLGMSADDFVMIFVGAGHFERKGLLILLQAMQLVDKPEVKLIVVGGRQYMVDDYSAISEKMGLKDKVHFVGYQNDIRPYLQVSDIFAFPSAYEVFPLVSLEAAAAGLPLLSPKLNGVEEFLKDGVNGWEVERTPEAFAKGIQHALDNREELKQIGQNAAESVMKYTPVAFGNNWKAYYHNIEKQLSDSQSRRPSTSIKTEAIKGVKNL